MKSPAISGGREGPETALALGERLALSRRCHRHKTKVNDVPRAGPRDARRRRPHHALWVVGMDPCSCGENHLFPVPGRRRGSVRDPTASEKKQFATCDGAGPRRRCGGGYERCPLRRHTASASAASISLLQSRATTLLGRGGFRRFQFVKGLPLVPPAFPPLRESTVCTLRRPTRDEERHGAALHARLNMWRCFRAASSRQRPPRHVALAGGRTP